MRNRNLHQTFDSDLENEMKVLDSEINLLELELEDMLDEYDVEFPSEDEIMTTINAIRPYVPVKENKWNRALQSMISITKQAYQEVFYISSLFWIANGLLFLIALTGVWLNEVNPYVMMMALAPIPTITGLIEVVKNRNAGMVELEMSYKYSFQEIILSKMLVVGGFNLGLNVLLTISLAVLSQELMVSKLLLYWLTPFTIITALSLALVSRFRKTYAVTAGVILWLSLSGILSQPEVMERIESIPIVFYGIVIAVAAITAWFQAANIHKRGVTFEINHQ